MDIQKMIVHEPDEDPEKPWALYTRDGSRLLGRHKTRQGAVDQEAAIRAAQHSRKALASVLHKAARLVESLRSFIR
jgi:hypothetical protein